MGEREKLERRSRDIEQLLARDLQTAGETARLANQHLQDLSSRRYSGAQPPDSTIEIESAIVTFARAQEAWTRALSRYVEFVKDGSIPDDITR